MRQTVIALRLADLSSALDERDRATTYYLGLLMNVYCHADATEQAAWFGDDIAFKSEGFETLGMNTAAGHRVLRCGGSARTARAVERARRLAAFPVGGCREMQAFLTTHTALGAAVRRAHRARRVGAGRDAAGLRTVGRQGRARTGSAGDAIALPARIVQLADVVEVFSRTPQPGRGRGHRAPAARAAFRPRRRRRLRGQRGGAPRRPRRRARRGPPSSTPNRGSIAASRARSSTPCSRRWPTSST